MNRSAKAGCSARFEFSSRFRLGPSITGVYSSEKNKAVTETKSFPAADLANDGYSMIDLGQVPLEKHLLLWIAPAENTEHPFNLYVDRIIATF